MEKQILISSCTVCGKRIEDTRARKSCGGACRREAIRRDGYAYRKTRKEQPGQFRDKLAKTFTDAVWEAFETIGAATTEDIEIDAEMFGRELAAATIAALRAIGLAEALLEFNRQQPDRLDNGTRQAIAAVSPNADWSSRAGTEFLRAIDLPTVDE